MLYQTIAELLESTANMTVIRNNSRQDDGTDTVTGVDWFKFRGTVANNIYVNGNGWINFGRSTEGGLKVNRRDQASWYVWREEGNIWSESNRFLRIRWRGYSQYNSTAATNLLEFDVVLCDTGDIILKIHTWPTANVNGVNQLEAATNIIYAPSQSATAFSFIHQDEDGNSFTLVSGIEEVYTPHFWLIQDGNGDTYTVDKDAQNVQTRRKLTGISTLTANTFCENGFQFKPDTAMLADLNRPKLCFWHIAEAHIAHADVNGIPIVPVPQLVVFRETSVKTNVQSIIITGDETTKWNVSFDGGENWYKHTGSAWATVTTDGDGCVKQMLEELTATDWAEMVNSSLQFRCWMMAGGWVGQIKIDY